MSLVVGSQPPVHTTRLVVMYITSLGTLWTCVHLADAILMGPLIRMIAPAAYPYLREVIYVTTIHYMTRGYGPLISIPAVSLAYWISGISVYRAEGRSHASMVVANMAMMTAMYSKLGVGILLISYIWSLREYPGWFTLNLTAFIQIPLIVMPMCMIAAIATATLLPAHLTMLMVAGYQRFPDQFIYHRVIEEVD